MDRDQTPQPVVAAALASDDDFDSRRCDRCRRLFDDGPPLDIRGDAERTLCPTCEAIRFPRRARSSAILNLVPPVEASDEDAPS